MQRIEVIIRYIDDEDQVVAPQLNVVMQIRA